jgi:hypothetical protein
MTFEKFLVAFAFQLSKQVKFSNKKTPSCSDSGWVPGVTLMSSSHSKYFTLLRGGNLSMMSLTDGASSEIHFYAHKIIKLVMSYKQKPTLQCRLHYTLKKFVTWLCFLYSSSNWIMLSSKDPSSISTGVLCPALSCLVSCLSWLIV